MSTRPTEPFPIVGWLERRPVSQKRLGMAILVLALLFAVAKNGPVPPYAPAGYESDMPAFGNTLSDEEIWAVLAYIKSHWASREVREARAQMETR